MIIERNEDEANFSMKIIKEYPKETQKIMMKKKKKRKEEEKEKKQIMMIL